MKTKLLTIAMTAALMLTAMTKVQAQNFDGPCLPPAHGLVDHQSAFCSAMQVIALVNGFNWVSFNVDITLDDLKAALVDAMPGATSIKIQSKDNSVTYNGSRWRGQLTTLSVEQMYKIETQAECEITLEGMPLNPVDHPITINAGSTWIGFPFAADMSLTDAFAGFAVSGDKISAKGQSASYNGTRWRGPLDTLVPGQGYVFESATTRTFTYPTGSSKAAPAPNKERLYPILEK